MGCIRSKGWVPKGPPKILRLGSSITIPVCYSYVTSVINYLFKKKVGGST